MTAAKPPSTPAAPQKPAKPPKRIVDWDALEPHYRAGVRSLKDIGREFDVSDAGIIQHARRNNWTRNIKAKVQARADALVSAQAVSAEVSAAKSKTKKAAEKQVIEIEATVQSRIRLAHRSDIAKARAQVVTLIDELSLESGRKPETDADNKTSRLTLSARTGIAKALSEALKTTIGLEREAYAIAQVAGSDNPLAALISQLGPSAAMPIVDEVSDEP